MEHDKRGFGAWLAPLIYLSSNWISLAGVVVVTAAAFSWFVLLPTLMQGATANPYIGILGFLLLPAVFLIGLLLIPLGIAIHRRALHKRGEVPAYPRLNLANPAVQRIALFVGLTTLVNLVITTQWTYSAVGYSESTEFCGTACHGVMEPEYTAHMAGTHSQVACIECHAGEGASGFVRAKLAGVHQLFAVMWNDYHRPVSLAPTSRPPARETCVRCHSLSDAKDQSIKIVRQYQSDEQNTPTATVLVMNVGAIHRAHTTLTGGETTIRYSLDEADGVIPWVERIRSGETAVYSVADAKAPDAARIREMDCMDCHNRPSHTFETPEHAVDQALWTKAMPRDLPFGRQQALEVLQADYTDAAQAAERIPANLLDYYRQNHPDVAAGRAAEIEQAGHTLADIYRQNVFPAMNVTWRTYPNQLGHTESNGCFRCHGYDLSDSGAGGELISQDCSLCHNLVAIEETSPAALTGLGME